MSDQKFSFERMRGLLGRDAEDSAVVDIIEDPKLIERSEYLGYVELKNDGISVMFKGAALADDQDREILRVSALHLHRKGHEGYSQYPGELPNGISFNDREDEVLRKLGRPIEAGGGGRVVLNRTVPRWLRYSAGDSVIHLQMDSKGRLEMVTLYPLDTKLGSIPGRV